jgi:diguanylate cyclase (GGDEF)-like protein
MPAMRAPETTPPAVLAFIAAVSFALGRFGLSVGGFTGDTIAVWPAGGFALAALVLVGRTAWPAVLLGSFASLASVSGHIVWSLTVALGYTLEAVVGALLVERVAGGASAFASARSIFRFVAVTVFVSTPLSAAYGVLATSLFGTSAWSDFVYLWMSWWLANVAGVLVVAPLVLVWAAAPMRWRQLLSLDTLEAVTIVTFLTAVASVVFGGQSPLSFKNYPLEFLCVPVLMWGAFRQGSRTVVTATTALSGIAVWGTTRGFGPFALESRYEGLVLVQAYMSVMATTAAVLAAVVTEHRRAEEQLRELATTDSLTGLANHRKLIEVLRTEINRSNRTYREFSVLFLDLDGLKKINDEHGHLAGSRALCRLAEVLRTSIRTIDTPARYGGDEFAVVLPETPETGAAAVLERIGRKLKASPHTPPLTVSGGIAVCPRDGSSPTQLLRAADRLLYESKSRVAARAPETAELRTGTV